MHPPAPVPPNRPAPIVRPLAPATALLALALGACENPGAIDRSPSDLYVSVYVERGDSLGMQEGDTPLRAGVSVASQESAAEASDSTGPDGIAGFLQVPGERYTVSHEPTELPAGLERLGSDRQTVVLPPGGASDTVRFVYRDTTSAPPDTATVPGVARE
ncbi:MAG TPA: hypothetical protein VF039_11320 [Longimicrobiales bacterium]